MKKTKSDLYLWVIMISFVLCIVILVSYDSYKREKAMNTPFIFVPASPDSACVDMSETFHWKENGRMNKIQFDHMEINEDMIGVRWDFKDCEDRIIMLYYPINLNKKEENETYTQQS